MDTFAGDQTEQSPTQPNSPPKTTLAARLFSVAIVVYLLGCFGEFVFVAIQFGLRPAIVLSLISASPLLVAVRMYRRWDRIKILDFELLAIVLIFATFASVGNIQRSFKNGVHLGIATWTFFPPPSPEDVSWNEFKRELRKDPSFKDIEVILTKTKHIYFVSGTLASESDLDRLIVLANECGIKGNRLDGPYEGSVSITIPGTNRSKRFHPSD